MKLRTLFVAVMLGSALPVAAQDAATRPAEQAERVETRFNPPIGTVQRFRIKATKRGQTHSWVEELRFERDGAGYLAHWRMDPASFSTEMRHPALAPTYAPFIGVPVIVELDGNGDTVRIRDWEPLKARVLKGVQAMTPIMGAAIGNRTKAEAANARKAVETVNAMFAQLSAENAPDVVMKYLSNVLGWGDHTRTVGEIVEGIEQVEIPLFRTSVERRVKLTLAEATPETARFVITGQIDGPALKNMMAPIASMFENPDPVIRERARRSIAQLEQITMVQNTTVLVDRNTGLVTRLDQSATAGTKSGEALTIEWLRQPRVS
ncbi:hypothetical protein [Sphingomonas koreensis]